MYRARPASLLSLLALLLATSASATGVTGYYTEPTLNGEQLVFVSEGDLWRVPLQGGLASRLTSHQGRESSPVLSPDGETLAFLGRLEGQTEVYTMPVTGGAPLRRTHGVGRARTLNWTPAGVLMVASSIHSTLPNTQLLLLDVDVEGPAVAEDIGRVRLAQAAFGSFEPSGETLYFTRQAFQGSHTKRYRGGTAQNIWRFAEGEAEARPLTADYSGTSKRPHWWQGRVVFASDRDGTMNLWSMDPEGGSLQQHTFHRGWDVKAPRLQGGRVVYQRGADIHVFDIESGVDRLIPITLATDLEQSRENWVAEPMDYLTSSHLSPDNGSVVLTARGRVFVAPHRQGRLVDVTPPGGARHREARFMPDGKSILSLSDASGEVELWSLPANGVGDATQWTDDGEVLRWAGLPSPDGAFIAHHDKNQRLFLFDVKKKSNQLIAESSVYGFAGLSWSPDSRWLAYQDEGPNSFTRIHLHELGSGKSVLATSDRYNSYQARFSPDGQWLYFLSDRRLRSVVGGPWGSYQPEPFLDKQTGIFLLDLAGGARSPFAPVDELHVDEEDTGEEEEADEGGARSRDQPGRKASKGKTKKEKITVEVKLEGLQARLFQAPIEAGNYSNLAVGKDALFWVTRVAGSSEKTLMGATVARMDVEAETLLEGLHSYELSADGETLLVRKGKTLSIVAAAVSKLDLDEKSVKLGSWRLSVAPREEWRQMFKESWRLERDYFYDRGMHGTDWKGMLDKYLTLVPRVNSRHELADLMAQMVSELSALHTFVYGGDLRSGEDDVAVADLGARLRRDPAAGGYRVEHVYRSDPDELDQRSPLAAPGVSIVEGDVLLSLNGRAALEAPSLGAMLRHQAGQQVLVRVKDKALGKERDVILEPLSSRQARDLRYHEWEYTRRLEVEEAGAGQLGYVHLRAMGRGNFTEWAKGFYPVFHRQGLIIDVRHNNGGNIDSWIIGRLLRKAWFYWSQRVGDHSEWNMQYAFRGHVVVLCDESTASDGEAFSEGVKRLDLGEVIGTRTWGGEIWLTSSNTLVDEGIATAAEFGVYGPEGEWLIEGHGVEPDIVVDNLPHATFLGKDAQLEAAIAWLQKKIEAEPIPHMVPPAHPDKSGRH